MRTFPNLFLMQITAGNSFKEPSNSLLMDKSSLITVMWRSSHLRCKHLVVTQNWWTGHHFSSQLAVKDGLFWRKSKIFTAVKIKHARLSVLQDNMRKKEYDCIFRSFLFSDLFAHFPLIVTECRKTLVLQEEMRKFSLPDKALVT